MKTALSPPLLSSTLAAGPARGGLASPPVSMQKESRDERHRPRKKGRVKGILDGDTAEIEEIAFVPEAKRCEENGWQVKAHGIKARIRVLFNSYTMSDVILHVGVHRLPAHSFVLAAASPLFYKQLYEDRIIGSLTCLPPLGDTAELDQGKALYFHDVPHLALFEFIHYIYTDDIQITLDNVYHILHLSDIYKINVLGEKCYDFLQVEMTPKCVLRVLKIARMVLRKSIIQGWKAEVERQKVVSKFKELTLIERRRLVQDQASTRRSGRNSHSGAMSSQSSIAGSTLGSIADSNGSVGTEDASGMRRSRGDSFSMPGDANGAIMGKKGGNQAVAAGGSFAESGVAAFCGDLISRCWRCIQDDTDIVIATPDMLEQEPKTMAQVLALDMCSAPEIALFRCLVLWAQNQCRSKGWPDTAANQRVVIGENLLWLVRFASMTIEQIQWEVVPSGLLDYTDVQKLLYHLSNRGSKLLEVDVRDCHSKRVANLNAIARDPVSQSKHRKSVAAEALRDAFHPVYSADKSDPVDGVVGVELLRAALRQALRNETQKEGGPLRFGNKGGKDAHNESGGIVIGSAGMGPKLQHGSPVPLVAHATGAKGHNTGIMSREAAACDEVRGQTQLVEEACPQASDFVRLAPGFYAFRNKQLLEVWIEHGVAYCKNHGVYNAQLVETAMCQQESAREILGLSINVDKSNSVPFVSLLR